MNHKIVCGQIRPLESTRSLQVELSLRPGLGSGGAWGGGGWRGKECLQGFKDGNCFLCMVKQKRLYPTKCPQSPH